MGTSKAQSRCRNVNQSLSTSNSGQRSWRDRVCPSRRAHVCCHQLKGDEGREEGWGPQTLLVNPPRSSSRACKTGFLPEHVTTQNKGHISQPPLKLGVARLPSSSQCDNEQLPHFLKWKEFSQPFPSPSFYFLEKKTYGWRWNFLIMEAMCWKDSREAWVSGDYRAARPTLNFN